MSSSSDNGPIISVITAVFNAESCIDITIKSLLAQSFKHWELIVIDGGSVDSTLRVIQNSSIENLTVICEPDEGIYDAMNKGILSSSGKWLYFLNAGDTLASNDVLSDAAAFCNANSDASVVYGNMLVQNRDGKLSRIQQRISSQFDFWFKVPLCHQSAFIKFQDSNVLFYDLRYKICADYDLFWRLWDQGKTFKKFNKDVGVYQWGGASHRKLIQLQLDRACIVYQHTNAIGFCVFIPVLAFQVFKSFAIKIRDMKRKGSR